MSILKKQAGQSVLASAIASKTDRVATEDEIVIVQCLDKPNSQAMHRSF